MANFLVHPVLIPFVEDERFDLLYKYLADLECCVLRVYRRLQVFYVGISERLSKFKPYVEHFLLLFF